jgi:RimJ/RimL family protein N-acetyltransferase
MADRPPSPAAPEAIWRLRPVEPTDLAAIEALLGDFDEEDRCRRWFTPAVDLHKAALWAAHPDRQAGVGLVAEADGRIVGHGALAPIDPRRAEVAFEVAAPWRHHGIAGHILDALDRAAAERGIASFEADVLPVNRDMLHVFLEHGPCAMRTEDGVTHVVMPVRTDAPDPEPAGA